MTEKEPRIPKYAKRLLLVANIISVVVTLLQLRIWYLEDFHAISWIVILGMLTSSVINIVYQYYAYKITGSYLGLMSVVISAAMCIIVIAMKARVEIRKKSSLAGKKKV
jgi:ABC-type branched-subunit amino acid transport system permease subunit